MSERALCGVAWHRLRLSCSGGARRSVHDELRPHVPVRDHTLGALSDGGGSKYRRAAGQRAGRAPRPLGRALDLGCGRGLYTPELARRGWEAVGIDYVPAAIEAAAATSQGAAGLSYVVGDVTRLPSASLGTFDFFLDIGCFQGLDAGQRLAQGEGVCALANPGATLLLLSFGPSRWRWLVEGASQEEVQTAFAGWEMLASESADTAGLGWPMNKTAPRWYRMRRRT